MNYGIFTGITTYDLISYGTDFPKENKKTLCSSFAYGVGGAAANAAVTFAGLGGNAMLITCIGSHPLGTELKKWLSEKNVAVIDLANDYTGMPSTASVFVNTTNGSRTKTIHAVTYSAVTIDSDEDTVNTVKSYLDEALFLYADSTLSEISLPIVQYGYPLGKKVVLDGSGWNEKTEAFLEYTTDLIASKAFLPAEYPSIWDVCVPHNIGYVAITDSGKYTEWWDYNEVGHQSHGYIEPTKVTAVDTFGAGSILRGAYCYYKFVEQCGIEDALTTATTIATDSVKDIGLTEFYTRLKNI